MGFEEILGFLIVLFIFFFPLLRKFLLKKKKAAPQKEAILQTEEEVEAEIPLPPLPSVPPSAPQSPTEFELHSPLENRKLKTKLASKERKQISKKGHLVMQLIEKKHPLQTMVILSEIYTNCRK